jgi:DNA-binding LacI/PurR family transcriptional regulator
MASASRSTVAFLVRGLEPSDTYNRKSWTAVYDLARERSCNLLMVSGQVLDDPDGVDRAHSAVFRLLNRKLADGALLSPTVTNRASEDRLEQFDRELGGLPIVAASVRVGSRPLQAIANDKGVSAVVRHLIAVHGCRRIVHVRGPYPNDEAAYREAGWRAELERAGIAVKPEWLVPGGFDFIGLETIGQDILDRVGRHFDAVVACNDVAAHRVMEDFQRLGIRVPEDVKVVGFDDIEKSQYSSPALTTVRQPVAELARMSWNALDELRAGRRPADGSIPAGLVVRSSCGCGRDQWSPEAVPPLPAIDGTDLTNFYEQRMEKFQGAVYDLHNFIRAMNRVTEAEQLVPVLSEWLPQLGVSRFAVLRVCESDGSPSEHVCRWEPGTLLPTAPGFFSVLTAQPAPKGLPPVIAAGQFSMEEWFSRISPFVLGMFPLVTGDTWYGLALLELSRSAGLLELILQEQLASALDRIARERKFRETETLRRFAAQVAHEINTPLGALVSAHGTIEIRLMKLADEWMRFAFSLSDSGRDLFARVYRDLSGLREFPSPAAARTSRRHWLKVLDGYPDAAQLAEDLALLGFHASDGELRRWSRSPDFGRVIGFLAQLADLPKSTAIVGLAAEKIGNFVRALRQSLN